MTHGEAAHANDGPAGLGRSAVSISVVFPCLDEADSVAACVEAARAALATLAGVGEVIVVDNGSTDGSPELAEAAGARVVHESTRGYGSALRAGFAAAEGDVVIMADADMTYPLERIPDLVAPIVADEADLVLGSRLGGTTRETMPLLHRYIGTPVITWLTARACGRRVVGDSQSGFRAFRRSIIDDLNLRGSGMELATEMLISTARSGYRIAEVDTGYRPRVGESKLDTWRDGWRHLLLLLLLAPDLLLVGPGLTLTLLGVVMLLILFISPEGISVGSLVWQPVFFSGTALILGVQGLLAGIMLAHTSSVAREDVERRFRFVGRADFRRRCLALGVAMVAIGLTINMILLVDWQSGGASGFSNLGFTALAQALVVVGGTIAMFSIVSHFYLRQAS